MKKYNKNEVVTFLKTHEAFGGLSNMAAGYPITLYGVRCRTSEHLYQALKFPDHPEIQSEILEVPSPMGAKMVAKKYRQLIRPDWEEIKLSVMAYCLRAKLGFNYQRFGKKLLLTGDDDIVEISSKNDTYWGCVPQGDLLVGHNHLGVLLTNLREDFIGCEDDSYSTTLTPPEGVELQLNGYVIGISGFEGCPETAIDDPVAARRTNLTTQQPNSTNGGF